MAEAAFREAERRLDGLTARAERKLLWWLAARMPAWVTSDHLTLLGLAAMAAAGAAYVTARVEPASLHVVNLCLLLNWFGDSLDGTLARYRDRQRPRYGFYVDHLADAVGALLLLAGLGCSGLISPAVAASLLVAYYLVTINVCLATYALGVFQISYGGVGGTELRIVLAFLNLSVWMKPRVQVLGLDLLLFDVAGAVAVGGLLATLVVSAAANRRALAERERV